MFTTDITFEDRRSVRKQLKQQGTLSAVALDTRPLAARLKLYEKMARTEITLRSAMRTLIDSVLSSIGKPTHPDPEIAEFLSYELSSLEDQTGQDWRDLLLTAEFTKTWAGFNVSECVYDFKFGTLHLDTLLSYHPSGIIIRPDERGRLVEGKKSKIAGKKSGLYQVDYTGNLDERPLSMWKMLYLASESEFGRYYGRSSIAPSYKWYRLKEVFTDILVSSLGKVGERMLWVRMQSYNTGETRVNPASGREEPLTSMQLVKEQFERAEGIPSLLLLPYQQPDLKPEVGSVPLADQLLGEFILKCIDYASVEMVREFVPYFLIDDKGTNINASQTEKRMDVYLTTVARKRIGIANPFCTKALFPLVQWNYNRSSASIKPNLARVYSERSQDWVATMQMVKGLTDQGYFNPTNPQDWDMVRQLVRVAERTQQPQDVEFIKQVLINPRNRGLDYTAADNADNDLDTLDPEASSVTTDTNKPAKGIAATGQGTQGAGRVGRPTGSVTPLFNPRPIRKA